MYDGVTHALAPCMMMHDTTNHTPQGEFMRMDVKEMKTLSDQLTFAASSVTDPMDIEKAYFTVRFRCSRLH